MIPGRDGLWWESDDPVSLNEFMVFFTSIFGISAEDELVERTKNLDIFTNASREGSEGIYSTILENYSNLTNRSGIPSTPPRTVTLETPPLEHHRHEQRTPRLRIGDVARLFP